MSNSAQQIQNSILNVELTERPRIFTSPSRSLENSQSRTQDSSANKKSVSILGLSDSRTHSTREPLTSSFLKYPELQALKQYGAQSSKGVPNASSSLQFLLADSIRRAKQKFRLIEQKWGTAQSKAAAQATKTIYQNQFHEGIEVNSYIAVQKAIDYQGAKEGHTIVDKDIQNSKENIQVNRNLTHNLDEFGSRKYHRKPQIIPTQLISPTSEEEDQLNRDAQDQYCSQFLSHQNKGQHSSNLNQFTHAKEAQIGQSKRSKLQINLKICHVLTQEVYYSKNYPVLRQTSCQTEPIEWKDQLEEQLRREKQINWQLLKLHGQWIVREEKSIKLFESSPKKKRNTCSFADKNAISKGVMGLDSLMSVCNQEKSPSTHQKKRHRTPSKSYQSKMTPPKETSKNMLRLQDLATSGKKNPKEHKEIQVLIKVNEEPRHLRQQAEQQGPYLKPGHEDKSHKLLFDYLPEKRRNQAQNRGFTQDSTPNEKAKSRDRLRALREVYGGALTKEDSTQNGGSMKMKQRNGAVELSKPKVYLPSMAHLHDETNQEVRQIPSKYHHKDIQLLQPGKQVTSNELPVQYGQLILQQLMTPDDTTSRKKLHEVVAKAIERGIDWRKEK